MFDVILMKPAPLAGDDRRPEARLAAPFGRRPSPLAALTLAAALGLAACQTAEAPLPPAEPAPPPPSPVTGDDARLVPAAQFLTTYPEWARAGAVESFTFDGNSLKVTLADGRPYQLDVLGPEAFRVRFHPAELEADDSYAVVNRDLGAVSVTWRETPAALIGDTGRLRVELNRATAQLSVYRGQTLIAQEAEAPSWTPEAARIKAVWTLAEGDQFYGLGEKSGPMRKNGQSLKFWNSDTYRYTAATDPIYLSIPWLLNLRPQYSWGLLFDNTYQSYFNLGEADPSRWYFGALGGEMDYTFIAGPDGYKVLEDYTVLTGRMRLPPKWALGYQQSRYSYESQDEVMDLARTFRAKRLPADTIYLDIGFMEGFKSFTHDGYMFPDPKAMTAELGTLGFKTITIIDPHIKVAPGEYHVYDSGIAGDHFVKADNGVPVRGVVWPGLSVFPDYTRPETREWWGNLYQTVLDWGITAVWNDMNEPSVFNTRHKTLPWEGRHYDFGRNSLHARTHNVYGSEMIRATLEGLDRLKPNTRHFVLSRSGFAGLQRYAAVWTGDNTSNWEQLRMNIPMVINMGLSGLSFVGADVGGYSDSPDGELLVRWMQLGALIPLYRNHTEKNTDPQEPWAHGPVFEAANRKALELRYKLLPYLYDLSWEAHRTGRPHVRPLMLEFPNDPQAARDDQFLLGRNLLVAPVMEPGAVTRQVYLPAGTSWFDWYTKREHRGGQTVTVEAPLDRIPLFVRAGGIVPVQEIEQFVGQRRTRIKEFLIFPAANGRYVSYYDDETTMAYTRGEFLATRLEYTSQARTMTLTLSVENRPDTFRPAEGYALYRIANTHRPVRVSLDGREIPLYGDSLGVTEADRATAWYENDNSLLLKIFDLRKDQRVDIQF